MAIIFDIYNMADKNWQELRDASNGSIPSYMKTHYNATTKFDSMRGTTEFIFFSRESYVEFCLTWLD